MTLYQNNRKNVVLSRKPNIEWGWDEQFWTEVAQWLNHFMKCQLMERRLKNFWHGISGLKIFHFHYQMMERIVTRHFWILKHHWSCIKSTQKIRGWWINMYRGCSDLDFWKINWLIKRFILLSAKVRMHVLSASFGISINEGISAKRKTMQETAMLRSKRYEKSKERSKLTD